MDFLLDDDPRMKAAEQDILELLSKAVGHLPISRRSVRIAEQCIEEYRRLFKKRYGNPYPKCVVLPLPRVSYLKVVRRDQTEVGMANVIRNLWIEFPKLEADDIAFAVRSAWPHFKPHLPNKPPPQKPMVEEVQGDSHDEVVS